MLYYVLFKYYNTIQYTIIQQMNKQMTHYECVGEFHDVFGHPRKTEPYYECYEEKPNLVPFRIKLIMEEYKELTTAFQNRDLVEMADALCDISYVVNGAALCLGFDMDKTSMSPFIQIVRHDGIKYTIGDNEKIVIENKNHYIVTCIQRLGISINTFVDYADRMKHYFQVDRKKYFDKIGLMLLGILKDVYDFGYGMGFDMDLMFREVHRSNMAKTCSSVEQANVSVAYYREQAAIDPNYPYKNPQYRIQYSSNNTPYYIIYNADDSKILKKKDWEILEKPNLRQFF